MKLSRYFLGSCILLVFAALGALTGCGDVECGEGTVEQDGECVLKADLDECEAGEILKDGECIDPVDLCDDGAEYDEDLGTCVVPYDEVVCGDNTDEENGVCVAQEPKDCGPGTELDVNTNECIPTDENCGENTEFTERDGTHICLPTDEVCDEGTEFNHTYGLCFPDFDCQPGDVVIDGYCVPEVNELVEEADYTAGDNTNPDLGGTPVSIDVADVGESVIFSGVIGEPEDITGDGDLDQMVDVFEFDAQEGDWFEISVRSVGMPNPAFAVHAVDDEESDLSFERFSAVGTGQDKIRQIAIPADGTYRVTVLPEALLSDGDYLIGDDDWDYAGTLELLETPEAGEHDFEEENLENTIGKLSDNFVVVDEFEAGMQARFSWESKPEYADALATVWTSADEFVEETDEDSFFVDVPESGEFFVIFDWESKYGSAELDYEVSAEELLVLEDGEEASVDFVADAGDVLYVEQDNLSGAGVDVTVADEGGAVLVDTSLGTGEFVRYINLVGGDYEVTVANHTGDVVEGLDVDIDTVVPDEITDFEATYSSSANENFASEQDYYLVEFEEKTAFEIDVDRVGGSGYVHLMIYGAGDNEVLSEGPSSGGVAGVFEFAADTTYVIRVGGDHSSWTWDYDYDMTFAELTSVPEGDEVTETFSADDGDVVEITQTNYEGVELTVTVTDDASGDEVVSETLSDGELLQDYPMDDGDYTATFSNDGDAPVFELETSIAVLSPIDEETFDADAGDVVQISQSNPDDTTVDVFVTDPDGEVVFAESLSTSEELVVDVESDGEHILWYFRSGEAEDEQEVADIDFVVEVLDVFEEGDEITTSFTADAGDVLELTQDSQSGGAVEVTVSGDEGDIVETSVATDDLIRYVGLEGGTYDVSFENDSGDDILEFDETIGVIVPDEVTDFDQIYTGEANENVAGDQSYYLVEVEETAAYEINVSREDGSGWAHLFVYALGDEELDSDGPSSSDVDVTAEFEADTTYVLRIGGEYSGLTGDYDYELSFHELDVLVDGATATESISAEDGDLVELTQSNDSGATVGLTIVDDDTDDVIFDGTADDGETVIEFPLDEGDYTAEFENDTGAAIVGIETDATVYSPIEEKTFDAEAGDDVQITQSNDDGTAVDVVIVDEDDEIVVEDWLSTLGELQFDIEATGDYTIFYYQSGEAADEQEAENIEFVVEFAMSATIDTVSGELGDVIEIDRSDSWDDDDVDVAIVDGDGDTVLIDTVSYNGFVRYVGLEDAGSYDIEVVEFGQTVPDPDDYSMEAEVVESDLIDDTGDVYEGTTNEVDEDPQDFYLIELDETTTYDVTLTHTGGTGWGRVFIYALGDEQLERLSNYVSSTNSTRSLTFEFEADTPYVIRVGNDASGWSYEYDYELTFE